MLWEQTFSSRWPHLLSMPLFIQSVIAELCLQRMYLKSQADPLATWQTTLSMKCLTTRSPMSSSQSWCEYPIRDSFWKSKTITQTFLAEAYNLNTGIRLKAFCILGPTELHNYSSLSFWLVLCLTVCLIFACTLASPGGWDHLLMTQPPPGQLSHNLWLWHLGISTF